MGFHDVARRAARAPARATISWTPLTIGAAPATAALDVNRPILRRLESALRIAAAARAAARHERMLAHADFFHALQRDMRRASADSHPLYHTAL